jgi:hypothetical protein
MCGPPHLHRNPHQLIVGMIHIFPIIILYNHVMHDDTNSHDIPKELLVPISSRPPHNGKLGLQNSKCYLYIFPSRGLCIMNWVCFLPRG